MLNVFLNFSYSHSNDLPSNFLPLSGLTLTHKEIDNEKIQAFEKIISQFNVSGDSLLNEVFQKFYIDMKLTFNVVFTDGIPSPYDAWTIQKDGSPVILFNLSEWTIDEINQFGLPIIIHEVTHALFQPLLQKHIEINNLKPIDRIILDEGLAHFIGFPGDRSTLPNLQEKWELAEKTLAESLIKLDSDDISDNEKEDIILKSNTGPFWNKYGAISGMFRIAKIYSLQGPEGLTLIIENGQLPFFSQ